jgi:hypothetical protein
MKLLLVRDYKGADCNQGKLSFSTPTEDFLCDTIERPWIPSPVCRGGLKSRSCVPVGTYRLERHNTEAHPYTWALVNPQLDVVHFGDDNDETIRVGALIHIANYAREVKACIGVGLGRGHDENGFRSVTSSRLAMIDLKRLLPWTDDHTMEIR